MRAKIKKFSSLLLALMLVIGVVTAVPITASATETDSERSDSDFQYEIDYYTGESIEITGYNGSETELVIPQIIDGYTVVRIGSWAFYDHDELSSVTIPDSVTEIDSYAFEGCTGLTSVTIPGSVTIIDSNAFEGCTGLTNVTISDGVKEISSEVFYGCTGLADIIIPDSVTSVGIYAFFATAWYNNQPDGVVYAGKVAYNYKGKMPENTSIVLKDGTVGIADYAFSYNSNLTDIIIPDSVTEIGSGAFDDCTGLTEINVSENNPEYTSFDGALLNKDKTEFYVCPQSKNKYTIPDSVTEICSSAFEGCTALTSVTIPNSVTCIGWYAFSNCTGLTGITIPYAVDDIGSYAFGYYYDNNTEEHIKLDGFTITGYPGTAAQSYADDNGFEFIALDPPEYEYYISEENNGIYITGYNGSDTEIVIPSEIDGRSVIGVEWAAFYGCAELTSVTIQEGVISIGSEAFSGCTGLRSVTIPDSVTDIDTSAFTGCKGLTEINIYENNPEYSSFDGGLLNKDKTEFILCPEGKKEYTIPDSVISICYNAFSGCTGLTSITISNSVTYINSYAFSGCTGLTEINVSENNPEYSSVDGAVFNKDKTEFILCPEGKKEYTIPDGVSKINGLAFENCSLLTSVTIPDSVIRIGSHAFYDTAWYNNQLDGVVYAGKVACGYKGEMPENTEIVLKDGTLGIADCAFAYCWNLADITIPDSVIAIGFWALHDTAWYENQPDGVVYVGKLAYGYKGEMTENVEIVLKDGTLGMADSAFNYLEFGYNTLSVTSITMPDSVISIADKAFLGCSDLTSVTISENVKSIGDYAFYECDDLKGVTIPQSVTRIGKYALGYMFDFDTYSTEKLEDFKISGYTGTAAEQYAKDNGFEFIALEPEVITGDASGDGRVDAKDRMLLSRYLAKWKGYENIDVKAADVNNDGEVNAKDRMILARHLAKWQGYETLPLDK